MPQTVRTAEDGRFCSLHKAKREQPLTPTDEENVAGKDELTPTGGARARVGACRAHPRICPLLRQALLGLPSS